MARIISSCCENLFLGEVTIPSGASVSELIKTQGFAVVGVIVPSQWTAASLALSVATTEAGTLAPVYDSGGVRAKATVTAGACIPMPFGDTVYAPFVKLASVDASNNPVNQAADRVITLLLRRFLS